MSLRFGPPLWGWIEFDKDGKRIREEPAAKPTPRKRAARKPVQK